MSMEVKDVNIIELFRCELFIELVDQLCCLNTALVTKGVVHDADHRESAPCIPKNAESDVCNAFDNVFIGLGRRSKGTARKI